MVTPSRIADRAVSGAAESILADLSALGARIERRGARLVLCPGYGPVPQLLVERARAAKPELLALLDAEIVAEPIKTATNAVVGDLNPDPQFLSGFAGFRSRPPTTGIMAVLMPP